MEISQECYRSRERFVDQILKGFASGSVVRNLPAKARDTEDAGDLDLIPGSGRSPGAGNGNPLQYSCWRIPQTEEPGELHSIESQRVGHD